MKKKVQSVKLDDRGFVELATLDNGKKIDADALKFLAKIGNVEGVYLARTVSTEEVLLPKKNIPVA